MFLIQSSVIGALACLGSVTAWFATLLRESRALSHCYHVGDDSQHSSATMFGSFAHHRTATMLGMTRNIAPLPCCWCTCSATGLLGRHPSRCSRPLFRNHVRVNSVLAARTACLASRVACVRACSLLSHPRPPDRSQHRCTVGVDRDPPV